MSDINSIDETAPKKRKTDDSSSRGSLHPSSGASRDDEKEDVPSDTTKRKGPTAREDPQPLFDLERVVGPKGRATYENRQKLQVLEFSRLVCVDGQPVGNRGAAKVFGIEPKLLRNWGSQEAELRSSFEGDGSCHAGGGARSLHPGGAASIQEEV